MIINGGKCTEQNAGIIFSTKFGLTEDNDAVINKVRVELGFKRPKGHIHLSFKVDGSRTGESGDDIFRKF